MPMLLHTLACRAGDTFPLAAEIPDGGATVAGIPVHALAEGLLPHLPVGTRLRPAAAQPADSAGDGALFAVSGHCRLPASRDEAGRLRPGLLLTALRDTPALAADFSASRTGWALAWITLSDKGSKGLREDTAGPLIEEMVSTALPLCHARGFLLPDDGPRLRALLTDLALNEGYDLIFTTGGTGLSSRDVTPQATEAVIDRPLPGFVQAMMAASLAKTPRAALSRATAGIAGRCLIINLPGSRKAVRENLEAVMPALGHALDKLNDDPADCGA